MVDTMTGRQYAGYWNEDRVGLKMYFDSFFVRIQRHHRLAVDAIIMNESTYTSIDACSPRR